MKQPHEKIYLQWGGDGEGEVTWCQDAIHDDDIEYVRADILAQLRAEVTRLSVECEAAAELITDTENSLDDYGHTPFHYLGDKLTAYRQARAAHPQEQS